MKKTRIILGLATAIILVTGGITYAHDSNNNGADCYSSNSQNHEDCKCNSKNEDKNPHCKPPENPPPQPPQPSPVPPTPTPVPPTPSPTPPAPTPNPTPDNSSLDSTPPAVNTFTDGK